MNSIKEKLKIYNQKEVSKSIDVPETIITRYKNGKIPIGVEYYLKLVKFLEIDPFELIDNKKSTD